MIDVEAIIPGGVLCLFSAWNVHGLTTSLPQAYHVAVKRGRKITLPTFPKIELHHITDTMFDIGVEELVVSGYHIHIYNKERCVCDDGLCRQTKSKTNPRTVYCNKTMSEIKNPGKSIRAKLLNVAKQKDVFYQTILTRYFQERLLYRISQTHYRENFYLKGGALMYAYEHFAARPTLDIDFLGTHISNDGERIAEAFREICAVECEEDGVRFAADKLAAQNITEFKDYHGIRLSIPATMDTIAQVLTMDIGFGDVVTPHPVSLDYPLLLEELPEANILAYSTETVIAEKMHAIIDLADQSSRMKDYYDIYHLLTSFKYDNTILQDAINRTFENRHTLYNADTMFFRKDFPNHTQMQLRWSTFLKKATIKNSLSFSEVAHWLQEALMPYWEAYGRM